MVLLFCSFIVCDKHALLYAVLIRFVSIDTQTEMFAVPVGFWYMLIVKSFVGRTETELNAILGVTAKVVLA